MFPRWLNKLMWYFDLWGLPTEFHVTSNDHRIIRLATAFQYLLGFVITISLIIYLQRPIDDPLGTLNDVVKHGGIVIVYWLALIELSTKKSIRQKFWQTLHGIDCSYCCHRDFSLRNYIIRFNFCLLFYTISFLIYLQGLVSQTGTDFLYFWFSHFISSILYFNRVFFYLFYLELIIYELCNVECEVKQLVEMYRKTENELSVTGGKYRKFSQDIERKRFVRIREYFRSICIMCNCLNEFLTYSNAAMILFSFQFIVTDVLWMYWKLYNKHHVRTPC